MIYLDNASTMPIFQEALEKMIQAWGEYANPGGIYKISAKNAIYLEELRNILSNIWGLNQEQKIIFTSSASESNSMITNSRHRVLATKFSHPSIKNQPNIKIIKLEGLENALENELKNGPALFSISSIQHETGIIFDLEAISAICKKYHSKLHIDAAQSKELGEITKYGDFVTVSAHKLGGPIAVAALITNERLKPIIFGGMQENNMRAGTQAIPLIAGFVEAVKIWEKNDYFKHHFANLKKHLNENIAQDYFLENESGLEKYQFANHIICLITQIPGSEIAALMDMHNIAIGIGSACMTGALNTMQTLELLDISNKTSSGIRISFGPQNTINDIEQFYQNFNNFMQKRLPGLNNRN